MASDIWAIGFLVREAALKHTLDSPLLVGSPSRRQEYPSLWVYERIMVSSILKRVAALTAWGCVAGNRTTSPAFTVMDLPAIVTSPSPSIACTSASNCLERSC